MPDKQTLPTLNPNALENAATVVRENLALSLYDIIRGYAEPYVNGNKNDLSAFAREIAKIVAHTAMPLVRMKEHGVQESHMRSRVRDALDNNKLTPLHGCDKFIEELTVVLARGVVATFGSFLMEV